MSERAGNARRSLAGAELDGLTGALNYAALRHELDREVARSERHHLSLSCCFIDLDRFKRVNDHHGHLYGSRMLAEVGASLGSGLRSEDTLGRYGGDEFVAILPETNEAAATALAGRLCSAIRATTMIGSFGPIGASIGVAQWQPRSSGEQLLEAADRALRAAKAAGGGTVISASALPASAVKLATSPVNGRVSDTPGRPVVRFCAHCGQRPPADTNANVRVCERCGLGILISAPAGAAPAVGEPFVIVDENLAVRALCKHADKLLGVSERWAIDRDIDELLTQADTDDPNITDLCAAIARSAQGDVELASVEVRLVNAAYPPFRVRIGPCGPPSAALLVLQDAS
jgi:diguanylate cyclase (GGDEF)-like protein